MKIETLKDLEAVLKVCRKHGVTQVSLDGIQMHLEVLEKAAPTTDAAPAKTEDELDEFDVAFWSAGAGQ